MKLVLNDEQQQVKESAAKFLAAAAPVAALRKLRDTRDETGYSRETWKQAADLGLASVIIEPAYGGLGMDFLALGGILEEAGRRLYASPMMATAVAAVSAIALAGTDEQRADLLPRVASGDLTMTLAVNESNTHGESIALPTNAAAAEGGYILDGRQEFVIDGHSADILIVAALSKRDNSEEAIELFLVPRGAPGVRCTRLSAVDSRNTAHIDFVNVNVDERARMPGQNMLPKVLDRARICLAAEMFGGTLELFERTVEYLKQREQFGVKIGTFQALRHRVAKLYVDIELTRSAILAALSSLDEGSADVPLYASLAKVRANETYRLMSNEAVQMHGGIGITDALDIGLFLKRARVAAQLFGTTRYLRDRYATVAGY